MADNVGTQFEVTINGEFHFSRLFRLPYINGPKDFSEYSIEKVPLESVFLKVAISILQGRFNRAGHQCINVNRRRESNYYI